MSGSGAQNAVQTSMWPDLVPDGPMKPLRRSTGHTAPDPAVLMLREPGWALVARRDGPRGWHRPVSVDFEGQVITACKLTGRVVREDERWIVPCSVCAGVA